jgi:hypothetical protein
MSSVRTIVLEPWLDLAPLLEGFALQSVSLGPAGELCALALGGKPELRHVARSGASFGRVKSPQAHPVRVLTTRGGALSHLDVAPTKLNHFFAQPLPDDRWLLVASRCSRHSDGSADHNGAIVNGAGQLECELVLGDGIEHVQTTADGLIWAGYFDEGVFGNNGWGSNGVDPVGASGLVCFDEHGRVQSTYDARRAGTDDICDCYALNVSEDGAWLCFYTDFPLVRLDRKGNAKVWPTPKKLRGVNVFAVGRGHVLLSGGYDKREQFFLYSLANPGKLTPKAEVHFKDKAGRLLGKRGAVARGERLCFLEGTQLFKAELYESF